LAWIAVVNLVGFMGVGDKVMIFQIGMVSAAFLGLTAFLLPAMPPTSTGKTTFSQIIGKDAFVLFKDRSFLLFFISSILICIPLSFYYTWANPSLTDAYKVAFPSGDPTSFKIENKMSLGQVSEVLFMLLLPLAYGRFGVPSHSKPLCDRDGALQEDVEIRRISSGTFACLGFISRGSFSAALVKAF
jgi:hypothetical protein